MASLLGSSMPVHSHIHSHSHSHPHSYSQSRPLSLGPAGQMATGASRTVRPQRSDGNFYNETQSESPGRRGHVRSHSHSPLIQQHTYDASLPTPPYSNGLSPVGGGTPSMFPTTYSLVGSETSPSSVALPLNNHNHSHHQCDHNHHGHHDHDHNLDHNHPHHFHPHSEPTHSIPEKRSMFTNMLLYQTQEWGLLQSILKEKDSRRIFYFMTLNFTFMVVQAFYGFVTDSLGLLSDSIHMFFDCLALALGLFASIASKWPPSTRFPYGLGMIESLSGFGNGVFLILISIEIIVESIERLSEGRETKRLQELLIVSSLGLVINLIGMACFGHHGHSGHDHSHGHGHSHAHSHSPKNGYDGQSSHDHNSPTSPALSLLETSPATISKHSHSHENENMKGIFLHVLADTMGSAAVIVSTLLIQFIGWTGWDPIASAFIAVLIFVSSIPLVRSSAKKLLLTVPADTEYQLRNTLAGISNLRGVAAYSVPRFWMADKGCELEADNVLGVMHVIAMKGSNIEEVRESVRAFLSSQGMDVVVQVDREGHGKCWCGGDNIRSPSASRYS